MHGDRNRLQHSRVVEGELIWQSKRDPFGHYHVFRKRSVAAELPARHSQNLPVIAQVRLAVAAKPARSAGDHRIECDAISFRKLRDTGSLTGHYAGSLVSHDHRRDSASRAAVETVYIAAANPARAYPHEKIVGPGFGAGDLDDFEPLVFRQ
jgi:hypothetical protein